MEVKVVNHYRGRVKNVNHEYIVVQCVHDKEREWRIPKVHTRMGPGIIMGPGYVLGDGWHGWVLEFDDGLHGFQPDQATPL